MIKPDEADWFLTNLDKLSPKQLKALHKHLSNPLTTFRARPDQPHLHDQQASFIHDKNDGISVLLGGVGSAKTYSGAIKTANLLLTTPPPRERTEFWCLSTNFENAANHMWSATMSQFIPEDMIDDIKWFSMGLRYPAAVILKPHANGNRWVLVFKSMQSDQHKLMGASIYGAWLDEFIYHNILLEVWKRIRIFDEDGSQPTGNFFLTLTPEIIGPELPEIYSDPANNPSWHFYHLNTSCNPYVPPSYVDNIKANNLRERWDCLLWGNFCAFQGSIFFMFNPSAHIKKDWDIKPEFRRCLGIDPGHGNKFAAVWAAYDSNSQTWIIYDEYLGEQTSFGNQVQAIKDKHPDFKGMIYFDPAVPQIKHEFLEKGMICYNAKRDVETGIDTVRSYMDNFGVNGEPRFVILAHCKHTIDQIKNYKWHPLQQKPIKENDDLCDAVRYCLATDRHYTATAPTDRLQRNAIPKTPRMLLHTR